MALVLCLSSSAPLLGRGCGGRLHVSSDHVDINYPSSSLHHKSLPFSVLGPSPKLKETARPACKCSLKLQGCSHPRSTAQPAGIRASGPMPQAYVLQIRNYRRHSAAFSEVELGFCAYRVNCNDTPVYEFPPFLAHSCFLLQFPSIT